MASQPGPNPIQSHVQSTEHTAPCYSAISSTLVHTRLPGQRAAHSLLSSDPYLPILQTLWCRKAASEKKTIDFLYITKLLLCHICCAVCYLHCILCLTFLQCIFICAEKYKAKNRDILWRLKKGWGQWMSDFLCVCQCFEFPSASLFTDIQSVNPAPLRQTFLDLMLEEHGGWPADRGLPEIQPLNLRCWFILTRACMKYSH